MGCYKWIYWKLDYCLKENMAHQQLSTNTFTAAKWIVSADPTQGTHTTIQAAINAASSGDTILIRDGTYTEDPVLSSGISLTALSFNAIINGACTFSSAGSVTLSGITLQTNSNFFLSVTGANASIVNLNSCNLFSFNNIGINLSSTNAASRIFINNCFGLANNAFSFLSITSVAQISITNSILDGSNTTPCIVNTGVLGIANSIMALSTSTSGSGILSSSNSNFFPANNNAALISSGTGVNFFLNCIINSASSTALSIGSGTKVVLSQCTVSSSNNPAISGVAGGTLAWGSVTFLSNSSVDAALTLIVNQTRPP